MISCLYPDCTFKADELFVNIEQSKRAVINHINADHAEAHVLIACSHEWEEQERFEASTVNAQGVKVSFPQIKSQCVRCGQGEVRDVEEVDVAEAAPDATATEGVTLDE